MCHGKELRCCGHKNRIGIYLEEACELLHQTPNKIPTFMCPIQHELSGAPVYWEKDITLAYSKTLA